MNFSTKLLLQFFKLVILLHLTFKNHNIKQHNLQNLSGTLFLTTFYGLYISYNVHSYTIKVGNNHGIIFGSFCQGQGSNN